LGRKPITVGNDKLMDVAANSYKNKIIGKSSAQFWKEQILELGGDYMIWSNAPENPYLN
jgi:putative transcriptional regulator